MNQSRVTYCATLMIAILSVFATNARSLPGYHINSEASAKRAVKEFADDNQKFSTCVYQALVDKNSWRLALAAHDYVLLKPKSPEREVSFARAYWASRYPLLKEDVPPADQKTLGQLYSEAVRCTKDGADKLPKSITAHLTYGFYLQYFVPGMENVPAMLKEFKLALALDPKSGECHNEMAKAYFGSGSDTVETIDLIIHESKLALQYDPRQNSAWFTMAAVFSWPAKHDYKSSRTYLQKFLEHCPEGNGGVPGLQKLLSEKLDH